MAMVKSAYSSGKPSFGVGAGNVQCLIDKGYDLSVCVPKIIAGRIFDNGIICSGEQTAIAHKDDFEAMLVEFVNNGAYIVREKDELDRLRETLSPGGKLNKDAVGASVAKLAEMAGIKVPEGTKVLVVVPEKFGEEENFAREKMCPVIAAYKYSTWPEGVGIALANLEVEGKGHSASIHSDNKMHVEYAMDILPVSRIVVNQICSTMNGGSFFNGLNPTTTLGCGSWGNNSISENLSYKHLINVSRIAYVKPGAVQPSDDEIWG
jgi:succinate-semialdehyde dehydrogenase